MVVVRFNVEILLNSGIQKKAGGMVRTKWAVSDSTTRHRDDGRDGHDGKLQLGK